MSTDLMACEYTNITNRWVNQKQSTPFSSLEERGRGRVVYHHFRKIKPTTPNLIIYNFLFIKHINIIY
jgi:hypothetical protein